MKNKLKQLQEKQDELDKEILTCPRCRKNKMTWWEFRRMGVCVWCVERDMKNIIKNIIEKNEKYKLK
jgi:uncharacterized CHY-type Zn-finger protein